MTWAAWPGPGQAPPGQAPPGQAPPGQAPPGQAQVRPGPVEAWQVRPYSQLLRGPRHRWWRPLVGLGVLLLTSAALLFTAGVVAAIVIAVTGRFGQTSSPSVSVTLDGANSWLITPMGFLVNNLAIAAFIPLAMIAVWAGHGWRPRWVASVQGGVRWWWLVRCAGITAVVLIPMTALFVGLDGGLSGSPERDAAGLLAVVVISTPLQAAGEEYLFRGWLSQGIGSLIPRAGAGAVVAAFVSATVFALAHGTQDPWLFGDRFAFGLTASWLAWRTGGLEAGIAFHALNNIVVFVPTILQGGLQDALTSTGASPSVLLVDLVPMIVIAGLVALAARRPGLVRNFVPPNVAALAQPLPPPLPPLLNPPDVAR